MNKVVNFLLVFYLTVAINASAGSLALCFSLDHIGVKSNKMSCCGERESSFLRDKLPVLRSFSEKCYDIDVTLSSSLHHLIKSEKANSFRFPQRDISKSWILSAYEFYNPELFRMPLCASNTLNQKSDINFLRTVRLRLWFKYCIVTKMRYYNFIDLYMNLNGIWYFIKIIL